MLLVVPDNHTSTSPSRAPYRGGRRHRSAVNRSAHRNEKQRRCGLSSSSPTAILSDGGLDMSTWLRASVAASALTAVAACGGGGSATFGPDACSGSECAPVSGGDASTARDSSGVEPAEDAADDTSASQGRRGPAGDDAGHRRAHGRLRGPVRESRFGRLCRARRRGRKRVRRVSIRAMRHDRRGAGLRALHGPRRVVRRARHVRGSRLARRRRHHCRADGRSRAPRGRTIATRRRDRG